MDGYFQLINEAGKTSVMLYPARNGGEALDIAEVADYLDFREIKFNQADLYAAAKQLKEEPMKVTLCNTQSRPEQEVLLVRIAGDNMSATVRFYAPSNDGKVMEKDEILNDLKHRGIRHGVQDEVLDGFLKKREYCKMYRMAVGEDRTPGEDGRVEYYFNTDTKARPTLQEDGSVDFFHLNTINHCKKGDVLAKLIPEVPSLPGMNVRGEIIPGREMKRAHLRYGKNVELSEDGTEIKATVSGHIILDGDRVSVSDVLELNSVDNSTGNIEYSGSIQIAGSVCENFKVCSGGNIIVDGVVEGAEIEAQGDVIIARGMNGMGKGKIMAGGNVISKFFENAEVNAGGYVNSDSILHSTVNAKDSVHVGGKRGFVTGGRICATNGIDVKNLGSNMGADTVVEVGADPSIKRKIQELQTELQENKKVMDQAHPVLTSATEKIKNGTPIPPEQFDYIKNLYTLYNMKKRENKKAGRMLDELQEVLENSKNAAVTVRGDVYAGTRIVIGDVSMVVKGNVSYCKFVRERGDVKMKGL